MAVKKTFMCVRNGYDKEGKAYSRLALYREGKSKEGVPYEYLDIEKVEYIDGDIIPVGTFKTFELKEVVFPGS